MHPDIHAAMSRALNQLLGTARDSLPKSRESSLVVTKLEEAQMWLDRVQPV